MLYCTYHTHLPASVTYVLCVAITERHLYRENWNTKMRVPAVVKCIETKQSLVELQGDTTFPCVESNPAVYLFHQPAVPSTNIPKPSRLNRNRSPREPRTKHHSLQHPQNLQQHSPFPPDASCIYTQSHVSDPSPLHGNSSLSGAEKRSRVSRSGCQDLRTVLPERRRLARTHGGGGG